MSHKSKNLQYEMEEPAFLRRLRQQHAGGGGPDRYIAPRNKKTAVDDGEDAPAYVMEGSEVSRDEFDALTARKGKQEEEEGAAAASGEESVVPPGGKSTEAMGKVKGEEEEEAGRVLKENVTEIGVKGKKRKATKIGGDDEDEPAERGEKEEVKGKKGKATKAGSKPKKRAVKLSFDQE